MRQLIALAVTGLSLSSNLALAATTSWVEMGEALTLVQSWARALLG